MKNGKKTEAVLLILAAAAVVMAVAAFIMKYTLCGIVAVIQAVVFILALVILKKFAGEKAESASSKLEIFGVALAVVFLGAFLLNPNTAELIKQKYVWPEKGLAAMIVKPPSDFGKIQTDTDDQFIMDVFSMTDEDYETYAKACFEVGFTVDYGAGPHSMVAFNEKGAKLELYYDSTSKRMNINLANARVFTKITWPETGVGALLPVPDSTTGAVIYDIEDAYCVYVGESSKEDCEAYIEACKARGFNLEIASWEDYFTASNADGFTVVVSYEGNNSFYVNVHAPKKE